MVTAEVLGIGVDEDLVERWREWFAPRVQPFRVDLLPAQMAACIPMKSAEPTMEWQDTFFIYGGGTWSWLSEAEFDALRPSCRRSLLAVRRRTVRPKLMPVWPSELARSGDDLMFSWVASGAVRPSRHREVPAAVWERTTAVLPRAEQLAGTFQVKGSGPNCFGTVMAAAGVPGAGDVLIRPEVFQSWLDECTESVTGTGHDDEPGIIFVWTEHGDLAHATVSIGDGWMLTKPSRSWSSPRLVRTVRDVVNSWRYPDTRLSRYRILR